MATLTVVSTPTSQRLVLLERPGLFADALTLVLGNHGFDVRRPDLAREPDPEAVLGIDASLAVVALDAVVDAGHVVRSLIGAGAAVVALAATAASGRHAARRLGAHAALGRDQSLPDVLACLRRVERRRLGS
jgi:hypothetical protein